MPNNFRKTGTYYVSKAGSDVDPATAEKPRATIAGGLALISVNGPILVIGAGMYEEALNAAPTITYLADGTVKLRGNSNNSLVSKGTWTGFIFENYNTISSSGTAAFTDCIFTGCTTVWGLIYSRCLFINCTFVGAANLNTDYSNCIFINCTNVSIRSKCYNSYFNSYSDMRIVPGADVKFNNVMGAVFLNNVKYENLAAQVAADPSFNINSINANPKFNNASKNDFTLQFDSPNLASGSGGSNIGIYPFAVPSYLTLSAEWQTGNGATFNNLELSGLDAVISSGQTSGTVTSGAKRLFANPTEIEVLYYYGQLMFNKTASSGGGGAMNNNVPDANVFAGSNANGGGNPDRLTIEARWSSNDEMPAQDSDWTNGGFGAAGLFYKFEINAEPRMYFNPVDNLYYGCGSASYVPSNSFTFPVVWIQYRVTLTNTYLN
jgi:hypothetical protein